MRKQSFKTRSNNFLIIYLCLNKPRCSKEIAKIIGNPHNDRNIQKKLLKLNKLGILRLGNNVNQEYEKSKYFVVDKERLANLLIDDFKDKVSKAKELGCETDNIKIPTKEEALNEFIDSFEVIGDGKKSILSIRTGKKVPYGLIKIAELIRRPV